ncbi:MAG: DUF4199 domain-containing protein [Bacteroidales bacterium]|nr:DUF4199 domain-containing protein [Bacteroidales bacterium]
MNMEQNVIQKNMWNTAGKAGLFLGLAAAAFLFISQGLEQAGIPAILKSILNFILWSAKFVGCIWIMKFFMKKSASENESVTNSDTFKLGMTMAFLSALVYSAFAFANVAFISPDLFEGQMEAIMQQMAPMMDSNTMSIMEKYQDNLAQITFFSNLIYCFLYGMILSFILSRNIPSKDPFADYKPAE